MDLQRLLKITKAPLLGILSTVNPSGSPQATPIWYLYDGNHFKITCHGGRIKVRNIRQNPKVSLVVVDTAGYGEPLRVNGTARIVEEGGEELTYTMSRRYQEEPKATKGAKELISYAHSIGQKRVIIEITPVRITYGD